MLFFLSEEGVLYLLQDKTLLLLCDKPSTLGYNRCLLVHKQLNQIGSNGILTLCNKQWLPEVSLPSPDTNIIWDHKQLLVCNNNLYYIGGYYHRINDIPQSSNAAFKFINNTWLPLAPMHKKRSIPLLVTVQGYILAIGGSDNSCEYYNTQTNTWTLTSLPPINTSNPTAIRTCYNTAASVYKGNVYLFGGIATSSKILCYDITLNKWTQCGFNAGKRIGFKAVTQDNYIMIIGGSEQTSHRNKSYCFIDYYYPDTQEWSFNKIKLPALGRCDVVVW